MCQECLTKGTNFRGIVGKHLIYSTWSLLNGGQWTESMKPGDNCQVLCLAKIAFGKKGGKLLRRSRPTAGCVEDIAVGSFGVERCFVLKQRTTGFLGYDKYVLRANLRIWESFGRRGGVKWWQVKVGFPSNHRWEGGGRFLRLVGS